MIWGEWNMNSVRFEALLSSAFQSGELTGRELRLTQEECDYLRRSHPAFSLRLLERSGDKSWYYISWKEAH